MVSAFYFVGKKQKFGRARRASASRRPTASSGTRTTPTPTAACPAASGSCRSTTPSRPTSSCPPRPPTTTRASALFPARRHEQTYTLDYVAGLAIGSYQTYQAIRPQKILNLDGNYFFQGMGGNNELKFGFGYRDLKTNSVSAYSGDGLAGSSTGRRRLVARSSATAVIDYGGNT